MKVVIAGSRRLGHGQAPRLLVHFLANLYDVDEVLLRRPMKGEPGPFEGDVWHLCQMFGIDVRWYEPHPTEETPGRASVYFRDIEMIEDADLVLLFFLPDEAVEGYSGTAHLMDKALDADRAVYAYAVGFDSKVSRVGEHDPFDAFADRVPVVP